MVITQAGGLGGKLIDMRRFDNGVPRAAEVAVSLIISDDKDDIGRGCCKESCRENVEEKCSGHEG